MQYADIPDKFDLYWALNASGSDVRDVPDDPSPTPGLASFSLGFPPPNFSPVASGGIPPSGADFNGIFRAVTRWLQWQQAGGCAPYFDQAFATALGGYPKNAFLQATSGPGNFWISTSDNNIENPDTGGAGWISFPGPSLVNPSTIQSTNATFNFNADTMYSLGLDRSAPAAMTVNLAAAGTLKLNQVFEVSDLSNNLSQGKVTVVPPSGLIGGKPNFVMNKDSQTARFKYFGGSGSAARWSVLSS